MSAGLFDLAQSALRALDPETAHGLAIRALAAGIHPRQAAADPAALRVSAFGLEFPNPLGMAAGFDKNGEVPDALLGLGFGFTEVGTVTPRPQAGNPRPRVFRLPRDRALINRLGFNNDGHAAVLARLQARKRTGIVGVNVGANKDSADRVEDYVKGIETFAAVASYFTVNISSPNTPGLRDLQARGALDDLLARVLGARDRLHAAGLPRRPVLLKIAPDLADEDLADIAAVALARRLDGLIVSNTTLARPPLKESEAARQQGGLSGRPLFALSTRCLARVHRLTGGALPLVGVGGVESAQTAYAKIRAGAHLVQLYSGLVYAGPSLVGDIKQGLVRLLARDGHAGVADAVGRDVDVWLAQQGDRA